MRAYLLAAAALPLVGVEPRRIVVVPHLYLSVRIMSNNCDVLIGLSCLPEKPEGEVTPVKLLIS